MDTFEIYTIGNAYFLEKMFNAIRMIFSSDFTSILKISVSISIALFALRASVTSDFKSISRWLIGTIVLVGLFVNTKAKIVIHDKLPDIHGRQQGSYIVDDVPWALAGMAHVTSKVGKVITDKFEAAFAGVTNSQTYTKYGTLFGSKIVEDASRVRITNAGLRGIMINFYKQCMIPDIKMGYARKNGYTITDLAKAENIGEFLKDHSSRARTIFLSGAIIKREKKSGWRGMLGNTTESKSTIDGYISCNKAAHYIDDMINEEIRANKHLISASFISQFMGDNTSIEARNQFFDSILTDSYGAFLKSSREASEILKQNIMINSIKDSASSFSSAYTAILTDETTRSSMRSIAQVAHKFIVIIRALFESLFYAVAPVIVILMLTPNGINVLKNYAFSFVYLQMWTPMYAILYVIEESWRSTSSVGLKHTMGLLPQIEAINQDISMVSGYMLIAIPILASPLARGALAEAGNMVTSMIHVPQSAAVQASDQALKGNFSMGNTSLDNHSYNNLGANKHDDNHSWSSGMKSWQQHTGSTLTETPGGDKRLNIRNSVSDLAGLAKIDFASAVGSNLSQNEAEQESLLKSASKDYTESLSSGMSKVLGYDERYSEDKGFNEAINKSMNVEQRDAADYVRGVTDRIAKDTGVSSNDVFKMAVEGKVGASGKVGTPADGIIGSGAKVGADGSLNASGITSSQKDKAWRQTQDAMKDEKFSQSLGIVETFGKTSSVRSDNSASKTAIDSMKTDFNQASSASSRISEAQQSLHSISQSKKNYENNSQSINMDLQHKLADWGMKKYGEEGFEQRIRNGKPEEINKLAQTFLNEEGFEHKGVSITGGFKKKDMSITEADHKRFETQHVNNQAAINDASGGFVEDRHKKQEELRAKHTEQNTAFEDKLAKQKVELAKKQLAIDNKAIRREKIAKMKTDRGALEHAVSRIVIDPWFDKIMDYKENRQSTAEDLARRKELIKKSKEEV